MALWHSGPSLASESHLVVFTHRYCSSSWPPRPPLLPQGPHRAGRVQPAARRMSACGRKALTLLSSVFAVCGLGLLGIAVSTDYWLYLEEGVVLPQNQSTEVKMSLHSGLWRVCFLAGAAPAPPRESLPQEVPHPRPGKRCWKETVVTENPHKLWPLLAAETRTWFPAGSGFSMWIWG